MRVFLFFQYVYFFKKSFKSDISDNLGQTVDKYLRVESRSMIIKLEHVPINESSLTLKLNFSSGTHGRSVKCSRLYIVNVFFSHFIE